MFLDRRSSGATRAWTASTAPTRRTASTCSARARARAPRRAPRPPRPSARRPRWPATAASAACRCCCSATAATTAPTAPTRPTAAVRGPRPTHRRRESVAFVNLCSSSAHRTSPKECTLLSDFSCTGEPMCELAACSHTCNASPRGPVCSCPPNLHLQRDQLTCAPQHTCTEWGVCSQVVRGLNQARLWPDLPKISKQIFAWLRLQNLI